MNQFIYDMHPFGAELIDSERARFRLWAPKLDRLTLELSDPSSLATHSALSITQHAMTRRDDGWFEFECSARAGTHYRYRLSDELAVPDPASRLQSDDVHGWSVLIDPREYTWRNVQWKGRPWHEMIIYEMHVGCCGGFAGVEKQLPQLAELGITAIELMPIADFSGKRNWGYDGVLPFAPDTAYGSPAQLKQLIDKAHELGLCIYLDVVYNHFGPDGNYLHAYAPDFFKADDSSLWGDRIDFDQRNVREFFIQNALYWLHEYRFDGLRFDAVHAISDPGWLDEMAARVRAYTAQISVLASVQTSTDQGRHIHLMLENERNAASHLSRDFNAQWNDDWHNVMHVLLTGEREGYYANYCTHPEKKLARSLAEGFVYQGEPSPTHDNRPRGEPSASLPPTAFINFLQNHDQIGNRAFGERLTTLCDATLCDEENLRAAIALQLLMPAIPLLFMGEPWQVRTPFLFFTDFNGELARAVREGRSNEFAHFSAFNDEAQRARIPDPNALETFKKSIPAIPSAQSDSKNSDSDFYKNSELYRELLQLRHRHIIPWLEHCRPVDAKVVGEASVIASWRFDNNALLTIAANFGDGTWPIEPFELPLLFESRTGAGALAADGKLAPHCTVVSLEEREISA